MRVCETGSTVSVGVACTLPSADDTSENLLKQAVDNVCKAKEMGRNRVVG
jgi:FOG: GGDEF domain